MEESRLCHLLWMIASLPPGSVQLHRLLDRFGSPEQVFLAQEEELQASGLLQDGRSQRLNATATYVLWTVCCVSAKRTDCGS